MSKQSQLYDKEIVFAGLAIFLIIVTFPFWYNLVLGKAASAPVPELTKEARAAKTCVRPAADMKAEHMQILNIWRHSVVRGATRVYTTPEGKEFEMSLTNSCLECHYNKTEFCDKCHTYASVDPYCWDCHIDNPKEIK